MQLITTHLTAMALDKMPLKLLNGEPCRTNTRKVHFLSFISINLKLKGQQIFESAKNI